MLLTLRMPNFGALASGGLGSALGYLDPVRVASTANVDIAALNAGDVMDGETLAEGDRVLLKNQDEATENGIYEIGASAGETDRADDFDSDDEVIPASVVPVQEGDENADTGWMLATDGPITLNGSDLTFINVFSNLVGAVTGSFTTGKLPKATGASTLGDSAISDNGSGTVTIASDLVLSGGGLSLDNSETIALGAGGATLFYHPGDFQVKTGGFVDWAFDSNVYLGAQLITPDGGLINFNNTMYLEYASSGTPSLKMYQGTAGAGLSGKSIQIKAGDGGAGDTNGGFLQFLQGNKSGSGTDGYILFGSSSSQTANLVLANASNANLLTIKSGVSTASVTYTLPTGAPAVTGYVLSCTTGGVMSWAAVVGGVTSDADENTLGGTNALDSLTGGSGLRNTGFGFNALTAVTTGDDNTAIGHNAGLLNTGSENTFIGASCGAANTSSQAQCFAGYQAGLNVTGSSNTIFGHKAGDGFTTGTRNTLVGCNAGGATGATAMTDCTFIGMDAGVANTGDQNTFIGSKCGDAVTSATRCTAVGYQALSAASASDCTAVGKDALLAASGTGNTAIGSLAGDTLTSGTYNTCIGYDADVLSNNLVGCIALGASALCRASGQFVCGSAAGPVTDIYFGEGPIDSSPVAVTFNGCGGLGTNIAGANLLLAGGLPTGTGLGGSVAMKYPLQNLSSASTLRSLSTQVYRVSGTLFSMYSHNGKAASVISTTETSIWDGTARGSISLEGGVLTPGRMLRVKFGGLMTTSGTPPTYRVRVYKGTNAIFDTGAITPTASMTMSLFEVEFTVTPRTFSATAQGNAATGSMKITDSGTNAVLSYQTTLNPPTIDCTATENLSATITFGANTSGNTFDTHYTTVEVLN